MRVIEIKKGIEYTQYEACEDGEILTSALDHPGPRDMIIIIHKGEMFMLKDRYLDRNHLEVKR